MQEKWMVELKGEEIDLQELDKFSSPPELEIKKEDKTYYLVSKEFEPSEEARIIIDIGKEIINIINGIAQLKFSNWKKINVGQPVFIDSYGKRHS